MNLNNDGSMVDKPFSHDYTGQHPRPTRDDTYASYHRKVDICRTEGFHLGDLSWDEWKFYCMGSGSFEGVDSETYIYKN